MNLRIRAKIFLTMILSVMLAIVGVYFGFQYFFNKGLLQYLNDREIQQSKTLAYLLEEVYERDGDWESLYDNRAYWRELRRKSRGNINQSRTIDDALNFSAQGSGARKQRMAKADNQVQAEQPVVLNSVLEEQQGSGRSRQGQLRGGGRYALLDNDKQRVIGSRRAVNEGTYLPLHSNGDLVGYLSYIERTQFRERSELQFATSIRDSLMAVSIIALGVTVLLALLLSYHLVRPIKALRKGTRELAVGNYSNKVEVTTNDELADLSHDFNQLANTLKQHEADRRQWVVDIAHELRTPLSVLRGELEAVEDGIEPLNMNLVQLLHDEVMHLQRLVEDLYDLSMSDNGTMSYKKASQDVEELLVSSLDRFTHLARESTIEIEKHITLKSVYLYADRQRMQQLFDNILKNSLRYTDSPGKIKITAQGNDEVITIIIEDSAPGVDDEALPHLFDRLYRTEKSRNRALGGAGIGLAICKNIVEAHEGQLSVGHSLLGGVKMTIVLPRESKG